MRGIGTGAAGKRSRARTANGRRIGATLPTGFGGSVHLTETIRAAAPHQFLRGRTDGPLSFRASDLRVAVREGRESNLVLFCVDASGSMAARRRMEQVKAAVLSLLLDAYQRRDKVGLVTFRGSGAEVALPPTHSVDAAATRLEELPHRRDGGHLGQARRVYAGNHRRLSAALLAARRPRDHHLVELAADVLVAAMRGQHVNAVAPPQAQVAQPPPDHWVALLPSLDPTTMGWRGREFYLDPADVLYLFDTNGNAGTTAPAGTDHPETAGLSGVAPRAYVGNYRVCLNDPAASRLLKRPRRPPGSSRQHRGPPPAH